MKRATENRVNERHGFGETVSLEIRGFKKRPQVVKKSSLCVDISSGGLGLMTEDVIEKGNVVKLEVPLSEEGPVVPVFAELKWSMRVEDDCRAGLSFLA